MQRFSLGALIAAVVCLAPAVASAGIYTFAASAPAGSGNQARSATATFTTNTNGLVIVIENLQDDGAISNQAVSGIQFTLSGSPTGESFVSGISQAVTIEDDGTFALGVGAYNTTRWHVEASPHAITAIGGGQPDEMIIGEPIGLAYRANGGPDNFNPYLYKQATFTLAYTGGVTSSSTISNVTFAFGTGPDSLLTGTPVFHNPEPAAFVIWGLGALGIAGFRFVCRKRAT